MFLISEVFWQEFLLLLNQWTGIRFGDRDMERILQKRIRDLNLAAPEEYLNHLKNPLNKQREMGELVSLATTGETYFFRHLSQLEALISHLDKNLLQGQNPLLKIWSAGCSTGDEVYTMAILLEEFREKSQKAFEYCLVGTDLDGKRIETARRGFYSGRSLKEMNPYYLEKFFKSQGDGWLIREELREKIQFEILNLSDNFINLPYSSSFDVILCRNVFIYFEDSVILKILSAFETFLKRDGLMVLSPSESLQRLKTNFSLLESGEFFFYEPTTERNREKNREKSFQRPSTALLLEDRNRKEKSKKILSISLQAKAPLVLKSKEGSPLNRAQQLFSLKKYKDALELCQSLLQESSVDGEIYWLLYQLYIEMGMDTMALETLQNMAFLVPEDMVVRYHRARSLFKEGKILESQKEYRNLLRILEKRQDDERVSPGEGLTCGALKKICRGALKE